MTSKTPREYSPHIKRDIAFVDDQLSKTNLTHCRGMSKKTDPQHGVNYRQPANTRMAKPLKRSKDHFGPN